MSLSLRNIYQKDKGQVQSGGGAARTREAPSVSAGPISEKQIEAVRPMQRIMGRLEEDFSMLDVAQKAATKLNNPEITPEVIIRESRTWGATSSGGTSGSYDGRWGKNTKGSLQRIADFVQKAGIKGVVIQTGNGISPFKEMQEDEIIKIANDNITNLGRLFVELGRAVPQEVSKRGGSGYVLDKVPESLDNTMVGKNPWPDYYGSYPVTAGDVKDIASFFYLIQGLRYTNCEPLSFGKKDPEPVAENEKPRFNFASLPESAIEKIARQVLEGSIFKLAQEAPVEEVKPVEEAPENGVCFNVIEDMLNWFHRRARMLYEQISRGYEKSEPHPLDQSRVISSQDAEAAKHYMAAIRNLSAQWASIRKKILKELEERNMGDKPVVTLEIFMDSLRGGLGESSGGRAARRRDEGNRGGAFTVPGGTYQKNDRGPIDNYMPLDSLNKTDGFKAERETIMNLASLTKGNELPSIDMREWRSGNWTDIATQYIDRASQTEQLRLFPNWALNVGRLINEMFRYWQKEIAESDMPRDARDSVMRNQQTLLSRWNSYIRSMIADANRNMPDELARINSGRPPKGKYQ